jgi:hypothetical protein
MGAWKSAPRGLVRCAAVACMISLPVLDCAAELPDSPGATISRSQSAAENETSTSSSRAEASTTLAQVGTEQAPQQPMASSMQSTSTQSGSARSSTAQSSSTQSTGQSQAPGQKPVGTAAAESVPATGVAASQPAGTAIAPGKQRRTRSIVLKVGALVGAGVAVGTVAALSLGTSSKPPGAR